MFTKLLPCALLAVLTVPAVAQTGQKKEVRPLAAPARGAKPAHPAGKPEFSLPVQGLTDADAAAVESTLAGLTGEFYECTGCGHAQPLPGECKGCEMDLTQTSGPVFKKAVADAKQGTVTFHLAKGQEVRLSRIQDALKSDDVSIEREKLALPPQAVLVFEGAASKEDATALQGALRAAKVAGAVAFPAPDANAILVRLQGGSATWAAAAKVGSELQPPLHLADLIFGAPASQGDKHAQGAQGVKGAKGAKGAKGD